MTAGETARGTGARVLAELTRRKVAAAFDLAYALDLTTIEVTAVLRQLRADGVVWSNHAGRTALWWPK